SVIRGRSFSSGALCRLVMPMRVKCGTTPAGIYRCMCGSTIRFEDGMMNPMRARGTMGSQIIAFPSPWVAGDRSLGPRSAGNNDAQNDHDLTGRQLAPPNVHRNESSRSELCQC